MSWEKGTPREAWRPSCNGGASAPTSKAASSWPL